MEGTGSIFDTMGLCLRWLLVLQALGFAALPLCRLTFPWLRGRGLALTIPFGIALHVTLTRLLWSLGLLLPHPAFHLACLTITGLVVWALCTRFTVPLLRPGELNALLRGQCVFLAAFTLWALVRSLDPAVEHTEQPMDVMLVQACEQSAAPPVQDAWMAGEPLLYYTGGHMAMGHLGQLAGSTLGETVNLGQITWFGCLALLLVEILYQLAPGRRERRRLFAALSGGVLILLGSNVLGFLHAIRLSSPPEFWWWWKASRAASDLGADGQAVPLITEFPFFSFWLGDNHAHVLNLPTLCFLILGCLHLTRCPKFQARFLVLPVLALAWVFVSNTWDLPLALLVFGITWLRHPSPLRAKLLPLVPVALPALFLALPALLYPSEQFAGIALNRLGHTSPRELLHIFGFFVPGLLLLPLLRRRVPSFALILPTAGLCALAFCELFVVRDVFGTRMNTVFKFTYQAWLYLGLAAGVGLGTLCSLRRGWSYGLLLALPLLGMTLVYPVRAVVGQAQTTWTGHLDAHAALPLNLRQALAAMRPLARPHHLVAEAPGDSYNARHSVFATHTSASGVLGWRGHEVQWRPRTYGGREQRLLWKLTQLYEEGVLSGFADSPPEWIVLGPHERAIYQIPSDWLRRLQSRYDVFFTSPDLTLLRRRP